jgi:hypothetical protein
MKVVIELPTGGVDSERYLAVSSIPREGEYIFFAGGRYVVLQVQHHYHGGEADWPPVVPMSLQHVKLVLGAR